MDINPERLPRHLAAILYADVVGFSRMTEEDEEATYLSVRANLDFFSDAIQACRGEVKNYAGDAILAQFHSAEDALLCAACVQKEIHNRNQSVPESRKIRFRIGLNLGDIIEDRGDIFGDGVNVSARLEGLAKAEGICVSGSFYDAVVMKLPFNFEFMGDQQVKNISKPIRAYHAIPNPDLTLPDICEKIAQTNPQRDHSKDLKSVFKSRIFVGATITAVIIITLILLRPSDEINTADQKPVATNTVLSEQPSIIVLPFDNISHDENQEYFVDGITEDIITDLSRLANIQVMARNTSFRYKGQAVKPQQIAKDLKVHYMLEGSVRKAGNSIRINAQLINTRNGYHMWAERYDRELTEVFAVQDEVTRNIVKALSIKLSAQEEDSISKVSTNNIEAYESYLRARRLYTHRTKESNLAAQEEFKQAIKLDPTYARAYGGLAVAVMMSVTLGWNDSPVISSESALEFAKKAAELDSDLPQVYWSLGFVHLLRGEYNEARVAVDKAIELAPGYADGYGLLALINNRLGNGQKAIDLISKAINLNPYYSWDYPYNLGRGYYTIGNYQQAIDYLKQALSRNENAIPPRLFLAASYSALNNEDEANWEIEQILNVNPKMSINHINNTMRIGDDKKMKLFVQHLRTAGMPEK